MCPGLPARAAGKLHFPPFVPACLQDTYHRLPSKTLRTLQHALAGHPCNFTHIMKVRGRGLRGVPAAVARGHEGVRWGPGRWGELA